MNNHLKPLFTKVIVDNYGVNNFLVNIGAAINLMSYSLLSKIEKFDTDLKPHNMVLYNYEGKINHSLWEIQVDLAIRTSIQPTLFMVIPLKLITICF